MTLHSAKGLEFNTVFMVGMEENIFPSSRAAESISNTGMEEERRLCYVGFTRARKVLYISRAMRRMRFDGLVSNPPSRFLKEVPDEIVQEVNMYGVPREVVRSAAVRQVERHIDSVRTIPPRPMLSAPTKAAPPDYKVGDMVMHPKFGEGMVLGMVPAGADYEVTVDFVGGKVRKFMSIFAKFVKMDPI